MLIKDKNGNFEHRAMTEITISDLDKKLDSILAYAKKIESAKRMDRYVDEGLMRTWSKNRSSIQRSLYLILNAEGKLDVGFQQNHDDIYVIVAQFLLRMAQEWKDGILLAEDIDKEFYDYLDKVDKYEAFNVFFKKNYNIISEMIKEVRTKHKEIESTGKYED